ncbi:MAG: sigma-70 family RNA polymerase sigma factor [Acidimicrobiia bacterium]
MPSARATRSRPGGPTWEIVAGLRRSFVATRADSGAVPTAWSCPAKSRTPTRRSPCASWTAFPASGGDSSLSTWIFSVARHTCLDVRRRRRGTAAQLEEQVPSSEATGAGEHSFDLSVAACRTALALRELPDSQQAVVLLRLGWGLSTQQTAERLGISRDAVKARLRRARVALRDSLEEALSCPACGPGSYRVTPEGIV